MAIMRRQFLKTTMGGLMCSPNERMPAPNAGHLTAVSVLTLAAKVPYRERRKRDS